MTAVPRTADEAVAGAIGLVRKLAQRYAGPCSTFEDLESEGVLGILRAWREWDGTRQFFALAASWAHGHMLHRLRADRRWRDLAELADNDRLTPIALTSDPWRRALLVVDQEPEVAPAPKPRTRVLSPTERQVLAALADGGTNRDVGKRLGMAEHTVQFHGAGIRRKLGVTSGYEAIRAGVRAGLIPCPFCGSGSGSAESNEAGHNNGGDERAESEVCDDE